MKIVYDNTDNVVIFLHLNDLIILLKKKYNTSQLEKGEDIENIENLIMCERKRIYLFIFFFSFSSEKKNDYYSLEFSFPTLNIKKKSMNEHKKKL